MISIGTDRGKITVREYQAGDEEEINRLTNLIFHETRSLEEWHWKFERDSIITVAEADGKIVGHNACLVARIKYRDKVVRAAQAVDYFVHPEFRAGGRLQRELLAPQPASARKGRIAFAFGFANEFSYPVAKWLLQYQDLFPLLTLFRRLNWRQAVRSRIPQIPCWMLALVGWASSTLYRLRIAAGGSGGILIRKVSAFDETIDAFWEIAKKSYGILLVRDRQFLNWRYAANPRYRYTIQVGKKDGTIVGYAVLKMEQDGDVRVGRIVDILTIDNRAAEDALVRGALRWFLSRRTDYVLCCALPEDRIFRALSKFGFKERPEFKPLPITYSILSDEIDEGFLRDARNWHITFGESDGV